MASTTKMMTAMLFADYVEAQGGDWDHAGEDHAWPTRRLPGGARER